jgi:hypothetical protein
MRRQGRLPLPPRLLPAPLAKELLGLSGFGVEEKLASSIFSRARESESTKVLMTFPSVPITLPLCLSHEFIKCQDQVEAKTPQKKQKQSIAKARPIGAGSIGAQTQAARIVPSHCPPEDVSWTPPL